MPHYFYFWSFRCHTCQTISCFIERFSQKSIIVLYSFLPLKIIFFPPFPSSWILLSPSYSCFIHSNIPANPMLIHSHFPLELSIPSLGLFSKCSHTHSYTHKPTHSIYIFIWNSNFIKEIYQMSTMNKLYHLGAFYKRINKM